jgi:penicillin-binding protein 1B
VLKEYIEEPPITAEDRPVPPVRRYVLLAVIALVSLPIIYVAITYVKYARWIDAELRKGAFAGTSDIYAAIPPRLVTNVSDRNREHRHIVQFQEIPKVLVHAVIAVEDKRFFQHQGFDPLRMLKAAYVDLKDGRKNQGASTLSMQLARSLWLEPAKNWKRKAAELAMTLRLEEKLTKEQIFTYYCNQVYLGRRGTFSLHGFGAAANAYFGKDIRDLSLPEAAMLAGLIQRPGYFHPLGNQDRMRDRRNLVLSLMRQNGYIAESDYRRAAAAPVTMAPASTDLNGAPYFLDLVSEEIQNLLGERDARKEPLQVYTTLDISLQQAANDAVQIGMKNVDDLLRKKAGKNAGALPQAQVALVALDPQTGAVRALVGGRSYVSSQLNRALAERQPGSVFKPFVYAAALNSALSRGEQPPITPATVVADEPTTFLFHGKTYEPGNFHHASYGEVTVREALKKSMNIPTVKIAEMTGYGPVADLARRAGLGDHVEATPSVALGSYEATPLDMAGAYTIYANRGVYVRPNLISQIKTRRGAITYAHSPETRQVLDPRVAYLMVNLMQDVMNSGTAAGVRSRGFTAPAAGKTGTSRDGWFAGFTSQLVCVVWVGFDDNSELKLEGAKSALPIWTEFMKRALQLPLYRDVKPFKPAAGLSSVEIDSETGLLATPNCLSSRSEFFIAGTEPVELCDRHRGVVAIPAASPSASVISR